MSVLFISLLKKKMRPSPSFLAFLGETLIFLLLFYAERKFFTLVYTVATFNITLAIYEQ